MMFRDNGMNSVCDCSTLDLKYIAKYSLVFLKKCGDCGDHLINVAIFDESTEKFTHYYLLCGSLNP